MGTDAAYERLAAALDRLPNGFPATRSRIEIRLLQRIFAAEEASLAGHASGAMEPVAAIAARAGLEPSAAAPRLAEMARRGLLWSAQLDDGPGYRLAPFIVGIYEAQIERMDHELAHLVEQYMAEGGAAGIMQPYPPLHRVLPAQGSVRSEWILPYEDVRALLTAAKGFSVNDCVCRVERAHLGLTCRYPVHACMSFSPQEALSGPGAVTREQALALLDQTEQCGLVHTVSNVMQGVGYVCNCCSCCCGILRGITDWGVEESVARANYCAEVPAEECVGCETCVDRCQVRAIDMAEGVAAVDRQRCIGCGLCVTGCPNDVARLQRRPDAEAVVPPLDFAAWERERLVHRGMAP